MDLDKLSSGEKIAGVSSALLFIFMFFDWFYYEIPGLAGSGALNAWDALDWIPIVLVITIVAALGVVAMRLMESRYEPPVSANAIVSILGGISFLLILYRIVDPPGLGGVIDDVVDSSPEFWIFVSLVCAGGIAYGAYKAMREEGASFAELGDRFSGGGRAPGGGAGAGPGGAGEGTERGGAPGPSGGPGASGGRGASSGRGGPGAPDPPDPSGGDPGPSPPPPSQPPPPQR